jgi:hypothetical protein
METKFHLLAVGQHFEWEGKSYVKTTPLIASQVPDGGQKFMPRAALVTVAGAEAAPAPITETPATLDSATVRSAIARCHQRCMQASAASAQQQGELEQIYRDLLVELKL